MPSSQKVAAVKVARTTQHGTPEQVVEARQELATANIEAAIERALSTAPPLTPDQIKRLSGLLKGGQR
jgi:hypothetical protein